MKRNEKRELWRKCLPLLSVLQKSNATTKQNNTVLLLAYLIQLEILGQIPQFRVCG